MNKSAYFWLSWIERYTSLTYEGDRNDFSGPRDLFVRITRDSRVPVISQLGYSKRKIIDGQLIEYKRIYADKSF